MRVRGLVVRYPGAAAPALGGVNLDVAAGALVTIVGPSGCGKSTLLRTLNRLVAPSEGVIAIGGRDVADQDPVALRRSIGYVIQAVGLFPHMTVAANVGIVPELLRWPASEIAARVDELLALVRLPPERYRARFPRQLSGGEAQRVGVARALAARPGLLLMDEPFGAVDALVRATLQAEVRRIHETLHTTIIFVTHDVDEALRLGDRIVVMRAGKVEREGTPLDVLAKPGSDYVASLLDAHDLTRRLQLLRVRDAVRPLPPGDSDAPARWPRIEASASLREALSSFLDGAGEIVVFDGAAGAIGTLAFADVQRALREPHPA